MKYAMAILLILAPLKLFAAASEWVDFTLHNGHIYLPMTIEGIETHALLDSGSQVHAINKAFVNKNDLDLPTGARVRVQGVHDVEERTKYNNVPVKLLGSEFELDNVIEINIGHHSNGMLLGAPFFYPFIIQIDYPEKKIRLLTRDSVDMYETANVKSLVNRENGMPIAEIKINGKTFWFLVDTGSNIGIFMERRFAAQVGLTDKVESSRSSSGANGSGVQEFANANTVQFGPFEIADVKVSFPAPGETTNLESQFSKTGSRIKGKRIVGIVGYELLQYFLLTMEYKTGKIHAYLPPES